MEQGAHDYTLYFIESGTLSAHSEDEKARMHMALVGAGTVLGEGSFFSQQPRRATVHASGPCKLWCLTPIRFRALASRHGPIALELTLAMGSVMAKRLCIRLKQAAVT
jgi:CRP/FNR family cyclic AMP-dependent transcriptional regulator